MVMDLALSRRRDDSSQSYLDKTTCMFNHLKCNSFKFLRTNGEGLSWNDLEKKTLPFISGKMTLSGEKNHKI